MVVVSVTVMVRVRVRVGGGVKPTHTPGGGGEVSAGEEVQCVPALW